MQHKRRKICKRQNQRQQSSDASNDFNQAEYTDAVSKQAMQQAAVTGASQSSTPLASLTSMVSSTPR